MFKDEEREMKGFLEREVIEEPIEVNCMENYEGFLGQFWGPFWSTLIKLL